MTHLYDDPAAFAEDALAGLCDAYSGLLEQVPGGAVRRDRSTPKVAVLYCGGSGHYPAFAGVVGPGLGDGAVCGNIFTSPSADHAVSVARAAQTGRGVVFSHGNYAGDVLNLGLATERLRAEGLPVENVVVTDDVASAPVGQEEQRRGIAGDFTVFKVLGAAAERGEDLGTVVALGERANAATRTMGVAFAGCTLPGAEAPLFSLTDGQMGLGLGIHGEPGLADVPLPRAAEVAKVLVDRVLAERPGTGTDRVAVILNGLGATKYEELFVLWRTVSRLLREAGLEIVAPEVGELVTSLDMAGVSLTVMHLDDELEELWLAPALTPAFTRGSVTRPGTGAGAGDPAGDPATGPARSAADQDPGPERTPGSRASQQVAGAVVAALRSAQQVLRSAEKELGRLDAVAGDGDHGRGMVRGVDGALAAAESARDDGAGAGDVLAAAADAWAATAGGTSGVLWGAGLRAVGEVLGNQGGADAARVCDGVDAYRDRLLALGKAQPGDKTMLDAVIPFAATLRTAVASGDGLTAALSGAAAAAEEAARATAALRPRVGRARPLADRSVGTPDPGAVSFARIVSALAEQHDRSHPARTEA